LYDRIGRHFFLQEQTSHTSKHIIEFLVLIPSCQHKFNSKKSIHSLLFSWKRILNINSSLNDNIRPYSYDLRLPFTMHARSLPLSKYEYKTYFGEIQQKNMYFRCFFVSSFSPSIINYACPNFWSTFTMALQHEFELSIWNTVIHSNT
jgi:hypothetical protein